MVGVDSEAMDTLTQLTEIGAEIAGLKRRLDTELAAKAVAVRRVEPLVREIDRLNRHIQTIKNEATEYREDRLG